MSPNQEPPKFTPERQREEIEKHLAAFILLDPTLPSDPDSVYQIEPLEGDPLRPLWDTSDGDPVLFALRVATHNMTNHILDLREDLKTDPSANGLLSELESAEVDLAEVMTLGRQYINPTRHPFYRVDRIDIRSDSTQSSETPRQEETP